ncbi:MAG: hypothetical protein H0X29_02125 [Parachlamydiaceae bacterium]|nr:hypothetical protein [Parachlamydiaceae bacterium]
MNVIQHQLRHAVTNICGDIGGLWDKSWASFIAVEPQPQHFAAEGSGSLVIKFCPNYIKWLIFVAFYA